MSDDILSLTAGELVAHYRSKHLSPVEVTRAALDRIAILDPIYNAFVLVDEARALDDARAAEPFWGTVARVYLPHRTLVAATPGDPAPLAPAKDRPAVGGRATAYVCRHFTCSAPVTTPEELGRLLQES